MGSERMQYVLGTLICLVGYICGLAIIIAVTPRLWRLRYDEGLFMGIAAADVLGGILVFAPIGVTFALFNGTFGIKVLDFLLLVGICIVGLRMSLRSFRPRCKGGTFQLSRILVGCYSLLLMAAAVYSIVLLFVSL
jgi:hypothetical protein